ncbi:alpha/beta fold hydrolase [Nakamurella sp. YIM 132087]|uniref:Alpha/beta fold hydrolase n=1 Tax=Nakamurella alba TaxID=2665158 RepID=A0A7K1FVM3_9ACTN|nr:alpha/beta hydrolase [Nakamurella alba]MTD16874.1 alpha/beta fold hydrolase [Nakamurella alba]
MRLGAHLRRFSLVAVLAASVTAGLGGVPAAAASAPAPTIVWSECDGFECGTAEVPLDHQRPAGERISLALIKLPATDASHRKGSLFLNPGGPGGSGVSAVRDGASSFPAELRRAYDIIGFDPRGIGESATLRCFTNREEAEAAAHTLPYPLTAVEKQQWVATDGLLADACAANAGPILHHMSTADVARDLDLLRIAVGDRYLNYLGYSYGSYLGMTYANLFPATVGAFVIDGVLDPVAWSTGRGNQARTQPFTDRILSAAGGEVTLAEFFRQCDKAKQQCAFSGNARARYEALLVRMRTSPVEFPGIPGFFLTDRNLVATTSGALYNPDSWSDFSEFLADLEAGANAEAAVGYQELEDELSDAGAAAADYTPGEGMQAVTCADTANPSTITAWSVAADRSARLAPHFGRLWTWQSSSCADWPGSSDSRYAGPWNRRTAHPVLVVGNHFDPSTPYTGAVIASLLMPNSRLLTYTGWGHLAYLKAGNRCIDDKVTAYLVSDTLPRKGTVCRPTGSPFTGTG